MSILDKFKNKNKKEVRNIAKSELSEINKKQIKNIKIEKQKKKTFGFGLIDLTLSQIREAKEIPWKELPLEGIIMLIVLAIALIGLFIIKTRT